MTQPGRGWVAHDRSGGQIGTVDAVFADYLLIRTRGWLPVDLYVPITAVRGDDGVVVLDVSSGAEAYRLWHRPLKRSPHD